jgi:hypothetical protein
MILLSRIVVVVALVAPWMLLAVDSVCPESSSILFSLFAFPIGVYAAFRSIRSYRLDIEFYRRGPQYYPIDSGVDLYIPTPEGLCDGYARLLGFYPFIFGFSSFLVFFSLVQIGC